MNEKKLLIVLAGVTIVILVLGIMLVSKPSSSSISGVQSGKGSEQVLLTTNPNPPKLGSATFYIDVKDKNGKPVDNAKVFFDLNMTTMNMGTQQGNATSQGNGRYAATGRLTMLGPWKVSTKITMPSGEVLTKDFTINAER